MINMLAARLTLCERAVYATNNRSCRYEPGGNRHTTGVTAQPQVEFSFTRHGALCNNVGPASLPGCKSDDAMISMPKRAATLLLSALIASMLTMDTGRAEPTFSFAATPGRLPKTVTPTH